MRVWNDVVLVECKFLWVSVQFINRQQTGIIFPELPPQKRSINRCASIMISRATAAIKESDKVSIPQVWPSAHAAIAPYIIYKTDPRLFSDIGGTFEITAAPKELICIVMPARATVLLLSPTSWGRNRSKLCVVDTLSGIRRQIAVLWLCKIFMWGCKIFVWICKIFTWKL